jgi:predicted  nucleic acid-binding Zn-ribbon protein
MTEEQVQKPVDRKDLKIQALINKVTKTENENADYQVELHVRTEELQAALNEIAGLREQVANWEASQQASQNAVPSEEPNVETEEVPKPTK